jgi:hypothetical protein
MVVSFPAKREGLEFTITEPFAGTLGHPLTVWITEYTVVVVGETLIVCVVAPPGDQLNVPPVELLPAVRVADPPMHIVSFATLTIGEVLTVTVPEAAGEGHPFNV